MSVETDPPQSVPSRSHPTSTRNLPFWSTVSSAESAEADHTPRQAPEGVTTPQSSINSWGMGHRRLGPRSSTGRGEEWSERVGGNTAASTPRTPSVWQEKGTSESSRWFATSPLRRKLPHFCRIWRTWVAFNRLLRQAGNTAGQFLPPDPEGKYHDKNDPSRFLGEGIAYKAKLIGILEVSEARGDKMCQDALNDLKTAIRAAGEHKQRITISISIDGLRLRDEKTGDCLYHHPVHKISFIAQDMTDSRAFGYIFGSPDTGHRFFGIKTDKTASQVVISMRDLFQVVFELKKKEIEMAKHHSEQHHMKYGNTGYMDTVHFPKDESDADKIKGKYAQLQSIRSRCLTSKSGEPSTSDYKGPASEAIADLLDLEHELNSIQQGINQMEKITPSDPFGPLSKGESYIDPFEDSFSAEAEKPVEEKTSSTVKSQTSLHQSDEASDHEKKSSFFGPMTSSNKATFFSQFSPGIGKSKADEAKWFDQETESLFNETVNVINGEPTSSPIALNTPAPEPDQGDGKKSPIKTDLFTELDPLGTGRVKPYVDKKDFFQELKNPPKKVLKELITEGSATETTSFYFPANFKEEKTPSTAKTDSAQSSSTIDSIQGFNSTPKYTKIDPFEDSDPFDKTDPFQEETFSTGFPSLFSSKASREGIFEDKYSWKFEAKESKDDESKNSPTSFNLFSSSTLRVSLPPERSEFVTVQLPAKLKSPPQSPENSKSLRRRNYQVLKQTTVEGSEESPVQEEPFVKVISFTSKPEREKKSPYKDKFYSLHSPPTSRSEKPKMYSSVEMSDATTPDPPPRAKTSLFSIRPPPLPPKKTSQTMFKPPARPPSLEDNTFHYDYLEKKENSSKEELKCVKLKKQLLTGKNSPPASELRKQNSESSFPILPPPPHRKTSTDGSKMNLGRKSDTKSSRTAGSILNLKLNQLDNTGLENLAITLGIPSESIYSMTLQELTKMLAEKYLISEAKTEKPAGDSFEVDFDANFAKLELNNSNPAPSYDKYAVFKELMENENNTSTALPTVTNNESVNEEEEEEEEEDDEVAKEEPAVKESEEQEEDKYAALRQLSLNVQKSKNFSEDMDDEDVKKEETPSQVTETETFPIPINDPDSSASVLSSKWTLENKTENGEPNPVQSVTERRKFSKDDESKDQQFPIESPLFPLVDQFSTDKKPSTPKDNWATFEKSDFGDTPTKKSSNTFNENENSPFSSDGKEDVREIPFHWHQNTFRKKTRKDVPWQDDDESWDDYSPKESFCSDESSHEDRSPDPRRTDRYEKPSWNLCERPPKTDRKWSGKGTQWSQRDKWHEETEDEFEDTWRKRRDRTAAYETDRKSNFWHNNYEAYNKHYDWCNTRSEPWDENERHVHCYMNRRKRSESDNEYRKRFDSDASDKECAWTFQKNYPETLGRSGKQKQYYTSSYPFRDCSEHCHESRSKHRKGASQKRPSSASESKRTYEKMSSPGDYPCRSSDKTYPGKSDKDEYFRYQCSRKDSRHRGDADFPHYYGTAEKRTSGQHSKMGSRTARASNSGQSDLYPSPNKRNETLETKNHEFEYFEPFRENNYKHRKSENTSHFNFDSEAENFEKTGKSVSDHSPQDFQKTPERRANHWASANGKTNGDGFFSAKNNNENFATFSGEFKNSPKKSNTKGKSENTQEAAKPETKSKPHLALLSRQESAATLRKSDSINIFSRDKDPFEGDDFFSNS